LYASLRKWKIGDRFLGDGDLRILAIILRGGGALPASVIAKDYGSTYPYERLPVLVEGGFLMHEAGDFRLTEKGMIAGVRGCLLIDEFRKEILSYFMRKIKKIFRLLEMREAFSKSDKEKLLDSLLEALGNNDEFFKVNLRCRIGEDYREFVSRIIEQFFRQLNPKEERFYETLKLWLDRIRSREDWSILLKLVMGSLGFLLSSSHYYFRSKLARIFWHIGYLLREAWFTLSILWRIAFTISLALIIISVIFRIIGIL